MTTLNFNKIRELNLTPNDIIFLQACHQNTGHLDEYILSFIGQGLNIGPEHLTKIKSGSIRLSKEGKSLLASLFTAEEILDDSLVADYLINLYKSEEDKIVCPKDKLIKLVAWLRGILGMDGKQFMYLLKLYFESEESKYNKRLDYLIYKPKSAYSGTISLKNGDSRLYNFYHSNKEDVDRLLTEI